MTDLNLATLTAQVKAFRDKAELGTLNHMLAVTIVASQPEGSMEMRDLAIKLDLAQATVSRLCQTLKEKYGLLNVERNVLDTRQRIVSLSDNGEVLAELLWKLGVRGSKQPLDKDDEEATVYRAFDVKTQKDRYGFAFTEILHRRKMFSHERGIAEVALKRLSPEKRVELLGILNSDPDQKWAEVVIQFLQNIPEEGRKIIDSLLKIGMLQIDDVDGFKINWDRRKGVETTKSVSVHIPASVMEQIRKTNKNVDNNQSEVQDLKTQMAEMQKFMMAQLAGLQATGNAGKVTVETDNTVSVEGYLNVPSGTTLNVPDGHTLNIETPKK